MTAHDTGALSGLYEDVIAVDRDDAVLRYTARARDGRPVQVWALTGVAAAAIADRDRFTATLESVGLVARPGLAPLAAWGFTRDGTPYLAYACAGRLDEVPRSPVEVARLGAPLASGVAALHASGLLHAGIRTDRIARDASGAAVLIGSGLYAALIAAGATPKRASELLASAPYASPEQRAGKQATELSDVYSLGAALYELLTGKPPFGGRTTSYVMAAVLSGDEADQPGESTPPSATVQPTGPALDAILRAIERAPDDRWPSMDAFASALSSVHTGSHDVVQSGRGCLTGATAVVLATAAALVSRFL